MKFNATMVDKFHGICYYRKMHAKNEVKVLSFSTKQDLADFLHKIIYDINDICEFNIIAHQISDMRNYFSFAGQNLLLDRLNGILNNGLRVNNYGSIYSTTNLLTTSKNLDIEKVVDYKYYDIPNRIIAICAIPKYIIIDNESVEFSSFNGKGERMINKELRQEYDRFKVFPYSDHCKCCLLDAVKMNDDLGDNLILGAIQVNEKEGVYKFYTAKTHMTYFDGETEKYLDDQQQRVKKLFDRIRSNNVKQAIVEAYIGESKYWDDVWAMDI